MAELVVNVSSVLKCSVTAIFIQAIIQVILNVKSVYFGRISFTFLRDERACFSVFCIFDCVISETFVFFFFISEFLNIYRQRSGILFQ